MQKASSDDYPLAIYYAFKQAEAAEEGITSSGWASFLQAVVDAGLSVDGTWPMRTESAGRLRAQGSNALASAIVLICRKRHITASVATRAEFIRSLKREMPEAIEDIRKAGVGPVDMQQSVIGPGMGVFSRYAKVLEDDDSTMPVKRRFLSSTGSGKRSRTNLTPISMPKRKSHSLGSRHTASRRVRRAN
jgi:putative DNA methylase